MAAKSEIFEADIKTNSSYDRRTELKAFDDAKTGVKGLVDARVAKIPRIFIHEKINNPQSAANDKNCIPVIDLQDIERDRRLRGEAVEKVREACEKWGFFQLINHGISETVLNEMIDGVRRFHEQETEVKKRFFTRDESKKVIYNTNFDFYQAKAANWRDSLYCLMAPNPPNPADLPQVYRDIMIDYSKKVMSLALTLFELLSEALGLSPNHLKEMGCAEGLYMTEEFVENRQKALVNWILTRGMVNLNTNKAEVAEFTVHKLKEMGKISQEDVSCLMKEFEDLDVRQCGFLSASDLVFAQTKI